MTSGSPMNTLCRALSVLIALFTTAMLTGCATVSLPSPTSVGTVGTPITARNQFSMAGRFSAKNEREQVSGQFRYAETLSTRTLSLFSPLGTAIADIVAERGAVTLTLANGATQTAGSVAELLRTVIDLPVTDKTLSAWLQGLPTSAASNAVAAVERDGNGWPGRFIEAGWEIVISERIAISGAPRRMRWNVHGQPDTEVRWVIDEWSAP